VFAPAPVVVTPQQRVAAPSTALLIVGVLNCACVPMYLWMVIGMASELGTGGLIYLSVAAVFSAVAGVLTIIGARRMLAFQSERAALIGTIVAMVPGTMCNCVGLPLGIWALVVLNRADVRAAFAVGRSTEGTNPVGVKTRIGRTLVVGQDSNPDDEA
jgi:hypothetical protein